jgi:GH25 family lysozyme M1 (1,4-beta-N-acetylmuramidase)
MPTLGVDVSHWEGTIDWSTAAGAIGFAYFKCTDGIKLVDSQFEQNRGGVSTVGIPHAPYHYYQPTLDPLVQAEHFIRTAGTDYPRYIVDIESPDRIFDSAARLQAFLQQVEHLTTRKPAIYTSAGYWNEFIQPTPAWASQYDLVVAHYTTQHAPTLPHGWDHWTIWQFSEHFWFPGCLETADGNWFNGSLSDMRKWFGNYRPVDPPVYNRTRVRSQLNELHIRMNPTTYSKEIGHLSKGEIVEIEELGGSDVWIKHERGWTAVECKGYRYMEVIK